jgi:2,4-dienoyl-CoA reductase-like NADH-dependent reductase (Old Yellow Enzyme family)
MTTLDTPLRLPCGATLPNRLARAALSEGLADAEGRVTPELEALYEDGGCGGFGLLIAGSVMVDARHLERPGNVIVDGPMDEHLMGGLRAWVRTATQRGSAFWAQLAHAGPQTPGLVNPHRLGPSQAAGLDARSAYGRIRGIGAPGSEVVTAQFAHAARVCLAAGFTGLQVQAAEHSLLAAFLDPAHNQRTDAWGGPLANRARLLRAVIQAIRNEAGPSVPIGVKLDARALGDDIAALARALAEDGTDLIEIAGAGPDQLALAGALSGKAGVPVMFTGGLRTRAGFAAALDAGIDVTGVVRPACLDPYCAGRLLAGRSDRLEDGLHGFGRGIRALITDRWYGAQLLRAAEGRAFAPRLSPLRALFETRGHARAIARQRGHLEERRIAGPQGRFADGPGRARPGPARSRA